MQHASGQTAVRDARQRLVGPDSCVDKMPDVTPSVLVTFMFKELTSLCALSFIYAKAR